MNEGETASERQEYPGRGRPLSLIERRVLGVLIEKAKATPNAYPLTLNAIVAGCNQKNSRNPEMHLDNSAVETALEALRRHGAVGIIQGVGRVDKYRHYAYEWLGVDKLELSVLCELLLRGPQTEGELRAHVSRMDPIPDLPALRTVLDALEKKGMLHQLTPPGRGHTVTHAFHLPQELERIRAQYQGAWSNSFDAIQPQDAVAATWTNTPVADPSSVATASPPQSAATASTLGQDSDLEARMSHLERAVEAIHQEMRAMSEEMRALQNDLSALRKELGGLG